MTVDTKLREAAEAVRNATRQAEFTAQAPGPTRRRLSGASLALITGLAVLVSVGVPALIARDAGSPGLGGVGSQTGLEESPTGDPDPGLVVTTTFPGIVDGTFPFLALEIPNVSPIEAYDIRNDGNDDRFGTHTVYVQTNVESGEYPRREILLRVQVVGQDYHRFTDLVALAESTETVRAADREVTIYVVPDEAIEEGSYDLHILRWIESPGIEAMVIPWGADRTEALDLMQGLVRIPPEAWLELTTEYGGPNYTTTTMVGSVSARTGAFSPENGPGDENIRLDAPDAPAVILELGASITLPPGGTFDRVIDNLPNEPTQTSELGLMVNLEFHAGCLWTGYWLDAVASGDTDGQAAAQAVLDQIPTWPALNAADGGGVVDAWTHNAQLAAAGDVQGVLDNLYTNNCTDVVPGQ